MANFRLFVHPSSCSQHPYACQHYASSFGGLDACKNCSVICSVVHLVSAENIQQPASSCDSLRSSTNTQRNARQGERSPLPPCDILEELLCVVVEKNPKDLYTLLRRGTLKALAGVIGADGRMAGGGGNLLLRKDSKVGARNKEQMISVRQQRALICKSRKQRTLEGGRRSSERNSALTTLRTCRGILVVRQQSTATCWFAR